MRKTVIVTAKKPSRVTVRGRGTQRDIYDPLLPPTPAKPALNPSQKLAIDGLVFFLEARASRAEALVQSLRALKDRIEAFPDTKYVGGENPALIFGWALDDIDNFMRNVRLGNAAVLAVDAAVAFNNKETSK